MFCSNIVIFCIFVRENRMSECKIHLEAPGGERRVLLHACCAPCSGAIVEALLNQGFEPVIFYSNSNIYPLEEYAHRRDECEKFARENGVEFVEDEYNHEAWLSAVGRGREREPERGARCLECFRFRLARSASYAARRGLPVLTTTLASSRWKNLAQVNEAGLSACGAGGDVSWWDQNWRKGGLQERRGEIIREHGFYNQLYCGCEFSFRAAETED